MKKQFLTRFLGGAAALAMAWNQSAQAEYSLNWTAFNDHYAGPDTPANVTAWNMYGTTGGAPGNTGPLRNVLTGENLAATLNINYNGTDMEGTSSGSPAVGTPAYDIFNGFIDWGNLTVEGTTISSGPHILAGYTVDYNFTGLNPEMRYSFVGTSMRGNSSYANRWTLVEIVNPQSATAAHSAGAGIYTNGFTSSIVALNSGMNDTTGDYVAWTDIQPASDGSFTIRCTMYEGEYPGGSAALAPYGYSLMAIRLQEFNAAQTPPAFKKQPQDQSATEGDNVTFSATASGSPVPSLQWYQNSVAMPGETNGTLIFYSVSPTLNGNQYYVVAKNTYSNATHSITSSVAKLSVALDTVAPTLLYADPTPGYRVDKLTSIELLFSKPVKGVDLSDLLINGNPATNLTEQTPEQYIFSFPQPPMGTINITWNANHGITDQTVSSNQFVAQGWFYKFDTNVDYESVHINEFMAANKHVIRDADGDYSDWIELYNSGALIVPLTGCYLTDDPTNLTKWKFPAVNLSSGAYLLVFASGKNYTNLSAALHTSFQLNKSGGYLALVKPDGTNIIHEFNTYPAQYTDVSYGCSRTDLALQGYFSAATPGYANATSGAGFAADVEVSRNSGTFTSPFQLSLSTKSTNAVIRYTFGTNAPTEASTLYTGPITVNSTKRIRARAFEPGLLPGDIKSGDFLLLDTSTTNVAGFSSDLPIIVIHNYGGGAIPEGESHGGRKQFALMQVFEPKNGRAALTNVPDYAVQTVINRRGQASIGNPKSNLRVETRNEYGDNKNIPLAGFPSDNDWVLYGINVYDKVLMHNPMAHGIYRGMGHYSSRTRYVEVYLKKGSGTPGPITAADYNGLYVLEEKIKVGPNRVNIDKMVPENITSPNITGGYLFSVDKYKQNGIWLWGANASLFLLDPEDQYGSQWSYIYDYLNQFYSALTDVNWTNAVSGYANYIDVPTWIDYHLAQVVVFNADMLRISSYYCKPRNGKFTPAALWDFDRAFGTCGGGDLRGFNPRRWRSGNGDGGTDPFNAANSVNYDNPWYGKLFTDPDFWQKYIDRYQELRQSTLSDSNITAMIDGFAYEVNEATTREYNRWKGGGSSDTTPNSGTVSGDGWTYTFPTPGTWAGQVTFTKTWFTNRFNFMDTNFLDRPTLSRPGGLVSSGTQITLAPAAKSGSYVIYTLDGTDPRLPGGAISPSAFTSAGTTNLNITGPVRVFARSWNASHKNLTGANNPPLSSSWSGVSQADFYTTVPALRITELMYHPAAYATDGTNSNENFEYIELQNTGSTTLNLAGFQISGGVTYTFSANSAVTSLAPGGYVLVVKSLANFSLRHPNATSSVAGEYTGQLNNAGDTLVLTGPNGEAIQNFTFNNAWYKASDGYGFSLVAVDPNASNDAWSTAAQWRNSAFDGGSPAAADVVPSTIPPVLVNEVLTAPVAPACDAIELWNTNTTTVDLGYWYLTDDASQPRKYLIPPGTTIPAGGYLVFYATNSFSAKSSVNALGATNQSFALSSEGEAVYLFSGDNQGHLTGYFDGFDFGPAEAGVTFGRYVNSAGKLSNPALNAATWGAANASPLVGPVVISEIMYAPPSVLSDLVLTDGTRDEFVELRNLTGEPVPLCDPAFPNNTWHVRGGISYDFPAGAILPPYGYAILVNFNPASEPDAVADFLNRHAHAANATLYGPYSGKLDNAGDEVNLRRPSAVKTVSDSPAMILVDRVKYGVSSPWPDSAIETGSSLQRVNFATYGDDPANWIAAVPTPGRKDLIGSAPEFATQPVALTVAPGTTAILSASTKANDSVGWQWYKNGQPIAEANASTLNLGSIQLASAGAYTVAALNDNGATYSASTPVVVVDLTAPQTVNLGDNVTIAAVIALPAPPFMMDWQWIINGRLTANGTSAATANMAYSTNQFTFANVSAAEAGEYKFVITNSTAPSAVFTTRLTVNGGTNVAPTLLAIELKTNNIILSWPGDTTGWKLQEAGNLVSPNWQNSPATPVASGNVWQAILPAESTTNRFFRLVH